MDAKYSVELQQAFVVDEDHIKKLIQLLKDRIGEPEIEIDCIDEVTRTLKSINELCAYENAPRTQIRRLHITANSTDFTKRARIDFSGARWRGISIDFSARDDVVTRLRTEVLDIVAGTRPFYSILQTIDFVNSMFIVLLLTWCALLILFAIHLRHSEPLKESNVYIQNIGYLIGIIVSCFCIAVGTILNRFRDAVFPRAVFLIGQGKTRYETVKKLQWGVVVSFLVSLSAGIILLFVQLILT